MSCVNEDAAAWLKRLEAGLNTKAQQFERAAQQSRETGKGAVGILDDELSRKLGALAKEEAALKKEIAENRKQAKTTVDTAIGKATLEEPKKKLQQSMSAPGAPTPTAPGAIACNVQAGLMSGLEFGTTAAVQKSHENQIQKRTADATERTAQEVAQMKQMMDQRLPKMGAV